MPLLPGKENIGHNISEMQKHGHSHAQSVAAAMHEANMKRGGKLGVMKPMKMKNTPEHVPFFGGLLHGVDGGRTDTLHIKVPSGAYVLPADIVSNGFGEGNTLAGAKILDKMFGGSVHAKKSGFAHGGFVPIVAAAGEYILHPEAVKRVGKGSMKAGHQIMDAFVKNVRKKAVKETAKLPGPKK